VAEAPYETGTPGLWTEFTIFPCGAVLEDDRKTLRIYYGAGDTSTNLATTTLPELWSVMTPCSRITDHAAGTLVGDDALFAHGGTRDRAVAHRRLEEMK